MWFELIQSICVWTLPSRGLFFHHHQPLALPSLGNGHRRREVHGASPSIHRSSISFSFTSLSLSYRLIYFIWTFQKLFTRNEHLRWTYKFCANDKHSHLTWPAISDDDKHHPQTVWLHKVCVCARHARGMDVCLSSLKPTKHLNCVTPNIYIYI